MTAPTVGLKLLAEGGGNILDVQVDSQDNVYVVGKMGTCTGGGAGNPYPGRIENDYIFTNTGSACNLIFLAKFNSSGVFQYVKRPQLPTTASLAITYTGSYNFAIQNDFIYWFVFIPTGTYADGAFTNSISGSNFFIFKYDLNGNFINATHLDAQLASSFGLYSKFYRNPYNGYYYITAFRGDATSTAVVGGQTVNGSAFIACFNELGQFQWKKESMSTTAGAFIFYNLVFDVSNNIYVSGRNCCGLGSFLGVSVPSPYASSFVLKTDPTADNLLWSTYYNDNGAYRYGAIALNGNEVGLAAYCFGPTFTWGSQTIFASNDNEGTEVMLARFNKDTGACLGLHKITGNVNYDDYGTALTVDASGDYILGGGFGNQLTINGNTLQNAGSQTDFFLAKFATSACSPLSNEEFNLNDIKVYPNPVKNNLYWQGETSWTSYEVYSLLGQKVAEGKILSGQNQISLSNLTKGIYLLKCSDESGNSFDYKIIKE